MAEISESRERESGRAESSRALSLLWGAADGKIKSDERSCSRDRRTVKVVCVSCSDVCVKEVLTEGYKYLKRVDDEFRVFFCMNKISYKNM